MSETKYTMYDIAWSLDEDEITDIVSNTNIDALKEITDIKDNTLDNLSKDQLIDYMLDYFENNPLDIADLCNLPREINIPNDYNDDIENENFDDLIDYISDEYEYLITDFAVRKNTENEKS